MSHGKHRAIAHLVVQALKRLSNSQSPLKRARLRSPLMKVVYLFR